MVTPYKLVTSPTFSTVALIGLTSAYGVANPIDANVQTFIDGVNSSDTNVYCVFLNNKLYKKWNNI